MLADDDDTTPSDEPLGKALTIWEGTETTLSKATQLPPQHHPTQNPPSGTRKHREKERERSDRVNINTSLPDGWPNLARRWHWTELSSLPISGADDCDESLSILPKWRGGGGFRTVFPPSGGMRRTTWRMDGRHYTPSWREATGNSVWSWWAICSCFFRCVWGQLSCQMNCELFSYALYCPEIMLTWLFLNSSKTTKRQYKKQKKTQLNIKSIKICFFLNFFRIVSWNMWNKVMASLVLIFPFKIDYKPVPLLCNY